MTESELDRLASIIIDRIRPHLEAISKRPDFISRDDYAKAHGISTKTVDRMIAAGKVETKRVGRRVLIAT